MQGVTPSIGKIKAIREARQCSVFEARRVAMKDALSDALVNAGTVEDLRPIVAALIEEAFGDE